MLTFQKVQTKRIETRYTQSCGKPVHVWRSTSGPGVAYGKRKTKGQQALGYRYEKLIGQWFIEQFGSKNVMLGPWYKAEFDSDAPRRFMFAQPDILIKQSNRIIVIECKLSVCHTGIRQLLNKYAPILEAYYCKPLVLTEMFKNWTPGFPIERIGGLEGLPAVRENWEVFGWQKRL